MDTRACCLAVLLACLPGSASPQEFGKNKVQYRDFNWQYVQSRHFDVYYYSDGKGLAEFVADVAESSYVAMRKDMQFDILDRIPILVYNSHNDFEQTNVTYYMIEESVGGFTEVFKDRVVLPFQGNYEEFRHVIHHELTHAVMFQMLYGRSMGNAVTQMARFQVPLWVAEGLAEYESLGWDTESDMFIRDAVINGYLPDIDQLYGFLVYKGGQSVLNYLADKYGGPKIGEVLGKMRVHRNAEQALKKGIGLDTAELSKRWHKYLKKYYWPDIENRDDPSDIAKKVTDHEKENAFLNNSPALSPLGDKMAYLSNRSDFIDVYVMNVMDSPKKEKIIKGERSDLFEELHWLRPGMDWDPEGKKVVLATKAGGQDAIHIVDVETKTLANSYKINLDGLFSPTWSPDGSTIAFMGMKGKQSDIYTLDLESEKREKLTDDIFSDMEPKWSPEGTEIVFVSDRGSYTDRPDSLLRIQTHPYHQTDVYILHVESGEIERITDDEFSQKSPVFSPDGRKIAFLSDSNGINNIFIFDRDTGKQYAITNLLTGASQISWSRNGSRMAFSTFFNGGYDIYLLTNPLDIKPGSVVLHNTRFREEKKHGREQEEPLFRQAADENKETNYSNYVFGEDFKKGQIDQQEKIKSRFLDTSQYKNDQGGYKSRRYKIRFTPDIITGAAGYSQFFGLQGTSMIALSDILGNHQINIYTDLFYNIKNSNFQFAYYYLPKRTDIGVAVFHYSYLYYTYFSDGTYLYPGYFRDRNYGASIYMSRPFNRYRRIDLGITGLGIDRDYGEYDPYGYYYGYSDDLMRDIGNLYRRRILIFNLGYSTDTVVWGLTGPVNGERSNITMSYSPMISKQYGLDFWTVRGDWRNYLRITKDFSLAYRFAGGASFGKNPQRFLLGGMLGWVNYQYNEIENVFAGEDLFYFSTFETPMRGYPFYEMIGTRFMLANLEFRFPLIRYLVFGWPLPIGFQNIRGALFLDMGSAWYNDRAWKPFDSAGNGFFKTLDMRAGWGFGLRFNLGFLLLKWDVAWPTDFTYAGGKAIHYFTLTSEF